MTNNEMKNWVEDNFAFLAISDAYLLIDKIYNDFKSRTCETCCWLNQEVCCNDESPLCADFVSNNYGCNLWEKSNICD